VREPVPFEKLLKRHPVLSQVILQAITIFVPAIYTGLLVDRMSKGSHFFAAIIGIRSWNVLLLVQLVAIITSVRLIAVVKDAKSVIKGLLETNARALSLAIRGRRHPMFIRSHFAACQKRGGKRFLVPIVNFNLNGRDDDDTILIEVSDENAKAGIMIVRAFLTKRCVTEDLAEDAHQKLPESLHAIRPDIGAVIACPVMDFEDPESDVRGTISFDLMDASIKDFHCTENDLKAIVRETAQTIFRIWNP
jgi:hypothetical protein